MTLRLNVGSGQRRFEGHGWVNVDCVSRPGQVPDVVSPGESMPFEDGSAELVVLHHVLEHYGCGEGLGLIRECHRVLAPGGSLLVFVPDARALAQAFVRGDISEFIYNVNMYGAYQGEEGDRHRWSFTRQSLLTTLVQSATWSRVGLFDWRPIPGASFARDWWIAAVEAMK